MKQPIEENKSHLVPRLSRLARRPSLNTSVSSTDSVLLVKKKFVPGINSPTGISNEQKPHLTDNVSDRLKVCEGERLSYEVMRKDSRQKKPQFLHKFAHDPFMRIKFQKSVQKFNQNDKSHEQIQKKHHLTPPTTLKQINKDGILVSKRYTTFRQKIKQESQKTVKLISNCKQLVQELKRGRLMTDVDRDEKLDLGDEKSFLFHIGFNTKKHGNNHGALTDRV